MTAIQDHMRRQMAFSRATYGPGQRRKGICDHLIKEIEEEILSKDGLAPVDPMDAAGEFLDVVLLGLDGMWRELEAAGVSWVDIPLAIERMVATKQGKNEVRVWPDWRTADPDKAVEHIKRPIGPGETL